MSTGNGLLIANGSLLPRWGREDRHSPATKPNSDTGLDHPAFANAALEQVLQSIIMRASRKAERRDMN